MSPNVKMLFSIIIRSILRNNSLGKLSGMELFVFKRFSNAWMPMLVSIFVYIEVASAVNNLAFGGSVNCFISYISCFESFMYDSINGSNSFILKSNQLLKIDEKLFIQLTTGQTVKGFLCTFGIP